MNHKLSDFEKDTIRKALIQVQSESFEDVPSEDCIDLDFSEDFADKVSAASRRRPFAKTLFNSAAKKTAVAAAVFIVSCGCLMSVAAIRDPFVSFVRTTYKKGIELISPTNEKPEPTDKLNSDTTGETERSDAAFIETSIYESDAATYKETERAETESSSAEKKPDEPQPKVPAAAAIRKTDPNESKAENNDPTSEPINAPDKIITIVEPTCTERGYTIFENAMGEEYISDEMPPIGHDYERCGRTLPTCSRYGVYKYR